MAADMLRDLFANEDDFEQFFKQAREHAFEADRRRAKHDSLDVHHVFVDEFVVRGKSLRQESTERLCHEC